jgi:hypothetical protein
MWQVSRDGLAAQPEFASIKKWLHRAETFSPCPCLPIASNLRGRPLRSPFTFRKPFTLSAVRFAVPVSL